MINWIYLTNSNRVNLVATMIINHVDSAILRYIIENQLDEGERLPPLTDLSATLNISVSKLREQLEVARSLNLVGVRPGSGTQVSSFNFAEAMRVPLIYSLARDEHHFESYSALRNTTTSAFWCEATMRLTPEDMDTMQALLDAAKEKLNQERVIIPHAEHRAFHLTLFKRLDNPFVFGVEEAYWVAYEAVELNRYVDYQYLKTVWDYHERMVELIKAKEYEASQEVFVQHTQLLKINHE